MHADQELLDAVQHAISQGTILWEEKVDGANIGLHFDGDRGDLTLRNRENHLKKGYLKNTPAKLQFRPLWNWIYANKEKFSNLTKLCQGETPFVYAEWLYAWHTVPYDALPDLMIPFDLVLEDKFVDPFRARALLEEAGFTVAPRLNVPDLGSIPDWANQPTPFSTQGIIREGVYGKMGDGVWLTGRVKHVRESFQSRKDFNTTGLTRNQVSSK